MYCIKSTDNPQPTRTEQDIPMRKPDIFDEIIQCLKTGAQTGADTSMNEEILRDLYARPVRKAAAQAPASAPASRTRSHGIPTRGVQGGARCYH